MGTRGTVAFRHDGQTKTTYNHYDSYPTYLGRKIFDWLTTVDFDDAIEKFDRLTAIDEQVPPTEEQKLVLVKYLDTTVSSRSDDDWYCLLRNTQGDPQAILDAGYYMPWAGSEEWDYVIDLDKRNVTVQGHSEVTFTVDLLDIVIDGTEELAKRIEDQDEEAWEE